MFIDTHCHLHDEKYADIQGVVSAFVRDGVSVAINMGCSAESSLKGKELSEKYSQICFATGCHPSDVDKLDQKEFDIIADLTNHPKCVAVGEIGLDYHWQPFDKKLQYDCFIKQLELAKTTKLPVSIHSRDATEDMLKTLKQNKSLLEYGGVMHCFSGSVETAKELLDLGLYLSFAGPLTFKNAGRLLDVATFVPNDFCLTETDSPYLAPHPLRGSVNEPKNVSLVTAFLAKIKEKELSEFAQILMRNAKSLFKKI